MEECFPRNRRGHNTACGFQGGNQQGDLHEGGAVVPALEKQTIKLIDLERGGRKTSWQDHGHGDGVLWIDQRSNQKRPDLRKEQKSGDGEENERECRCVAIARDSLPIRSGSRLVGLAEDSRKDQLHETPETRNGIIAPMFAAYPNKPD